MSPERILIADNDPSSRDLLASTVRGEGYSPVVVDDGREAYRTLQADANFAAGIFNITLPYLEGLDLIRYMKTEKRLMRIPVMMTSSQPDARQISDSFEAGATMFLPKPFSTAKLQSTLRLLFDTSRQATTAGN